MYIYVYIYIHIYIYIYIYTHIYIHIGCLEQVMALDCGRRMKFTCIGLSSGGRFLAVGCEDLSVRIWDLQAMEVVAVCRGHSGEIVSLAWAPDEKQLVSVGADAAVCVWNFYLGGAMPPSSGGQR